MTINLAVGSRLPAWVTSMGRVCWPACPGRARPRAGHEPDPGHTPHTVTDVAELRRLLDGVRADGYACVAQELEPGLQSVAVPIVDRSGRVIAAMNVSGHANRYTREAMLEAFRRRAAPPTISTTLLRARRRGRDGSGRRRAS